MLMPETYRDYFHLLTLFEDLQHLNKMTTTMSLKESAAIFTRLRNGGSVPCERYMVQNFGSE